MAFFKNFFINMLNIMLIRKACMTDIDSIHELDMESVEYHMKFDKDFYSISQKWRDVKKKSQAEALNYSSNLILVEEHEDRITAYIWGYIMNIADMKIGKIQELIVTHECRRKGIASALLNSMLNFFRSNDCITSEVDVRVENEPALKAFKKSGFRKQEFRMRLELDKARKFRPFE